MLEDTTAIILAGGLGTRLRSEVSDLPKVMAPVNGRPFLDYLLRQVDQNRIRICVLATGYQHEKISLYYGDTFGDLRLHYSVETEPHGTGGAVRMAIDRITTTYALVVNGDTFFHLAFADLMRRHLSLNADLTIALKPMTNISRYGTVKLQNDRVVRFEEKRIVPEGLINGGIYVLNKDIFSRFDLPVKFSLERDFLNAYSDDLTIAGVVSDGYFIDIGTPADYTRAQTELHWHE